MKAPCLSAYSLMPDDQLHLAIADLERRLDVVDCMQEPQAASERHTCLERLDAARAEVERRRT